MLTTLDPQTALILIDLQAGLAGFPTLHPLVEVTRRAAELARVFRRHGLPVVLVNVDGVAPGRSEQTAPVHAFPPGFSELLPELDAQPSDLRVTKRTWGAFTGTGLEASLRERGVTQVVIGGVATGRGVESTARFAHELGFNVTLATDAMTDVGQAEHDHCLQNVFPRLGEQGSCEEIARLLERTRAEA